MGEPISTTFCKPSKPVFGVKPALSTMDCPSTLRGAFGALAGFPAFGASSAATPVSATPIARFTAKVPQKPSAAITGRNATGSPGRKRL